MAGMPKALKEKINEMKKDQFVLKIEYTDGTIDDQKVHDYSELSSSVRRATMKNKRWLSRIVIEPI